MKTYLFALLLLVVALPATRAADADPRVQQLITQLGDEDFKKREAATADLKALGKTAQPQLKAAENHSDPEVRTRVAQLLQALEPPPTDAGTGTGRMGGRAVIRFGGGGAGGQIIQMRAVAGNAQAANAETTQQSAFEADGKKCKVTRTEKNGVKSLTVVVTETKDGKDISRTVEATDDADLAKKDAALAKLVKEHAGAANNEVQVQTGGQVIIQGGE
jgi:hypothetical protein